MLLTKSGFHKSEECASTILERYQVSRPAVPIEHIVQNEGLQILEYNFGDDISGILIINDGVGAIGVNPKNHYHRQRFSIAHELGHYLMHRDSGNLFVDKDFIVKFRHTNRNYSLVEKKQEQEANAFAAALLMPTKFIEQEIEKLEFFGYTETEIISVLAKTFQVSEAAMSYRFSNLNNFF